ncbi:MAG: STN domain-containing protein [Planctomycetota bacterium]
MKRIALLAVCVAWAWTSTMAGESTVPAEGKKAESAAAKAAPGEDPTAAEVRKKLERKVTFEFVDTPLEEGINFIRSLADVKVVYDPQIAEAAKKATVNLRVTDMTMELALQWILKLADLDYKISDGAIVICMPYERAVAAAPAAAEEDAWKQEIKKKLVRKVSFEFVDTPLGEAIQFLNSLTKANIIIDPKVADKSSKTPITLRVQDMEMELALKWILRLAELKYELRNQAVFITAENKEDQKPQPEAKP